jgi:hypothetical protein
MKNLLTAGLMTLSVAIAPLSFSELARAEATEEPFTTPITTIDLADKELLTVHLINNTGYEVIYQVLGDTEHRTLPDGESAHLLDLHLDLSLIFYYKNIHRNEDGKIKLIKAEVNPTEEHLEITLTQTTNSKDYSRTVLVDREGGVFSF